MAHFKKPTRIVLKVIFPRVVRTFVRLATVGMANRYIVIGES